MRDKRVFRLSKYVKQVFESDSNEYSEWFGYYNYDTLNQSKDKLLCNRSTIDGILPQKGMIVDLGYYDLSSKVFHRIGCSDSWNWQQGSMLQWLPGTGNENKVIFNISLNNRLKSKIINIDSLNEKIIDWPIYAITPDGSRSISIDFERSRWCRAYHYMSVDNYNLEGDVIESDGIFEINLDNNTRRRIISIQQIINTDPDPDFNKKKHWLEHVMISQDGKKFCFLHRFAPSNNIYSYKTRLFTANIDGSNLFLIPNWRDLNYTHFGWNDSDAFAVYTYKPPKYKFNTTILQDIKAHPFRIDLFFSRLIKSLSFRLPAKLAQLVTGGSSYYSYFKEVNGEFVNSEIWMSNLFSIDGHPSFTNDGRYMITDTYPDKNGYNKLLIFDTATKKSLLLAKFFAFYKGSPASCDLHPKLSKDNNYVVVDSAHDSKHHIIILELDWNKIKAKLSHI